MNGGTEIHGPPKGCHLDLHFRREKHLDKPKGVAQWMHWQTPPTATNTCSSTMHTILNSSQSAPRATPRAIANRAAHTPLSCSDLRIAQYLLNALPADSSAVTIGNRAIAKAISRSVRTVQDAFERLSRTGLIHRTQLDADDPFSLRQTTLNITAVRKALAENKAILSSTPAYFSPSWTLFQPDGGRDFSVIVDGISV